MNLKKIEEKKIAIPIFCYICTIKKPAKVGFVYYDRILLFNF